MHLHLKVLLEGVSLYFRIRVSWVFIWKRKQFGVKLGNCLASEFFISLVLRIPACVCL